MKRLVLTGATGFIGRYALAEAVRAGFDVHAFARRTPGENTASCTWHQVDLLDAAATDAAIRSLSPTHLLHLAWYAEPKRFWSGEANLDWLEASIRLLRTFAAVGGHSFVGAGSCAEYGWDGSPCQEDQTPLSGATLYAASKNAFRGVAERFCINNKLRFAWGRIFFAYGRGEDSSKLLSQLGSDAIAGGVMHLREPDRLLDYIHVSDVARGFTRLADDERATGAYNLGTGTGRTVRSMVEDLVATLGIAAARIDESAGTAVAPNVVADSTKLCELGWAPSVDFISGIRDLFEPSVNP